MRQPDWSQGGRTEDWVGMERGPRPKVELFWVPGRQRHPEQAQGSPSADCFVLPSGAWARRRLSWGRGSNLFFIFAVIHLESWSFLGLRFLPALHLARHAGLEKAPVYFRDCAHAFAGGGGTQGELI